MFWLFLGVLIWIVAHFFPSVLPEKRKEIMDSLGSKYMGIFAGIIVLSLVLIIIGWRSSAAEILYQPPEWGRPLNMVFMLVAVIMFGAAHGKSKLRQYIRHPMLTGVHLWALGHLLANGETRSVVLFGGMLIWSAASIYLINKRDGNWEKPTETAPLEGEVKLIVISLAVYAILALLHPYYTGMTLMTS